MLRVSSEMAELYSVQGVTYGAHVGLYWISPLGSARLYWSLYSVQGFKALAAQARGAGCA